MDHPTVPTPPTEPFLVGLTILLPMDQVLHQACVFYDPSSATLDKAEQIPSPNQTSSKAIFCLQNAPLLGFSRMRVHLTQQ